MPDLTHTMIIILRKYMRDQNAPVETSTTLIELDIDRLDLPMILLDAEDVFDVTIRGDGEMDDPITVAGLIACVAARIQAKALQPNRTQRPKGNWMSTGSARRP